MLRVVEVGTGSVFICFPPGNDEFLHADCQVCLTSFSLCRRSVTLSAKFLKQRSNLQFQSSEHHGQEKLQYVCWERWTRGESSTVVWRLHGGSTILQSSIPLVTPVVPAGHEEVSTVGSRNLGKAKTWTLPGWSKDGETLEPPLNGTLTQWAVKTLPASRRHTVTHPHYPTFEFSKAKYPLDKGTT